MDLAVEFDGLSHSSGIGGAYPLTTEENAAAPEAL
jgi:hypothetical protein